MDWKVERRTLTTREVCLRLGMSRPTLMNLVKEGEIKSVQSGAGKKHRFPISEVERFLDVRRN